MASTPKYPQFENCELDGKGRIRLAFIQIFSVKFLKKGHFEQKKSPHLHGGTLYLFPSNSVSLLACSLTPQE